MTAPLDLEAVKERNEAVRPFRVSSQIESEYITNLENDCDALIAEVEALRADRAKLLNICTSYQSILLATGTRLFKQATEMHPCHTEDMIRQPVDGEEVIP